MKTGSDYKSLDKLQSDQTNCNSEKCAPIDIVFLFFYNPSSCSNYCLLKNWIVGSAAASPSACQFHGLLHNGNGRSLVLHHHHWVQIWYTRLHVSTEWWVSCEHTKPSCLFPSFKILKADDISTVTLLRCVWMSITSSFCFVVLLLDSLTVCWVWSTTWIMYLSALFRYVGFE